MVPPISQEPLPETVSNGSSNAGAEEMDKHYHIAKTQRKRSESISQSWEPDVADQIKRRLESLDRGGKNGRGGRPLMVGLVGPPGSGKGVGGLIVADLLEQSGIHTAIVPHNGYHYPLEYLRTFPEPEDMIYRRGAPDTFHAQALIRDLLRIRDGDEEVITTPGFDHAEGDPQPDKHNFDRNVHSVVICEGLYLLHDADGWEGIRKVFTLMHCC